MNRYALQDLLIWKEKLNRKPLVIRGARRVGKTWLMREFAETAYRDVVYVNFANNEAMRQIFAGKLIPERLIVGLELYIGRDIDPNGTLLIFDDIQENPRALESLRYFRDGAPAYHIVCAGCFSGTTLPDGTLFPVDNIEFLDLHPLTFFEFAEAIGMERYVPILRNGDFDTAGAFADEYIDVLRQYYFVGGMPEAVLAFARTHDRSEVRATQKRILAVYDREIGKHAPNGLLPRIRMVWDSLPAQLAKDNRKFVYSLMEKGARAKDFERAIRWLIDCGLVHRVNRLDPSAFPPFANEDRKAFKLFPLDIGLLGCMIGLKPEVLSPVGAKQKTARKCMAGAEPETPYEGNDVFCAINGALTEQYVVQQFKATEGINVYYRTPGKGIAGVDYVLTNGRDLIPVEVRTETNLRAKRLKACRETYSPARAVRLSLSDYRDDGRLVDVPLYMIDTNLLLSL